ncbi:hypothetical protein AB0J85_16335 [Micromonospora echinofusca]|nr:hypothetical protein [Micromonospora sp. MSM11]MCL7459647.1 hypothetical protein [Micromonospora sp. MSM11]
MRLQPLRVAVRNARHEAAGRKVAVVSVPLPNICTVALDPAARFDR